MAAPDDFVVLPQIIVEAALTAGQPVSGPGTMTLDDASFGLLDTDWLAGADSWTDITQWVRGFTITRPFTRAQGPIIQFQAGTASITLNNSDGRFDPNNLSGPYVVDGVSQVHAMVPVRIRANYGDVSYDLYRGFADGWQENPVTFAGDLSDWTLNATDGFKILTGINLATTGSVGASDDTGTRINRILNAAGWYTGQGGGARMVDTGDSTLQATTFGDTALNLLQLACDSEIGQLYINGSGAVVFRHREALLIDDRSSTSQASFSDSGDDPDLPVTSITRADDDTTVANDIQATRVGGTMQEVTDSASELKYNFPRTYTRGDLILNTDADALTWASWVLYVSANAEDRFESITIDPQAQPGDLWPQVLGREMGDRVTVTRNAPLGGGSFLQVTRDCFISGIQHTFDVASSTWQTMFSFQDASKYGSFMTLDNADLGQLDSNALAF